MIRTNEYRLFMRDNRHHRPIPLWQFLRGVSSSPYLLTFLRSFAGHNGHSILYSAAVASTSHLLIPRSCKSSVNVVRLRHVFFDLRLWCPIHIFPLLPSSPYHSYTLMGYIDSSAFILGPKVI